MNRLYVLNNLLDESLFLKNSHNDTRSINNSKNFSSRNLAEKYLIRNKLADKYSVKLINKRVNESIEISESEVMSAIDDTKDMIDNTIDLVEEYIKSKGINEEVSGESSIEDILDRLRKLKKNASGICFRPSFYDSDGSGLVSDLKTADDPPEVSDGEGGSTNHEA